MVNGECLFHVVKLRIIDAGAMYAAYSCRHYKNVYSTTLVHLLPLTIHH